MNFDIPNFLKHLLNPNGAFKAGLGNVIGASLPCDPSYPSVGVLHCNNVNSFIDLFDSMTNAGFKYDLVKGEFYRA